MSRTTVSLDDAQAAWVERQADDLDISKSKVLRECVDVARGEQSMFTGKENGQATRGEDRVAALESRLDALEADVTERLESLESTHDDSDGVSGPTHADDEYDTSESPSQDEEPSSVGDQRTAVDVPDSADRETLESHLLEAYDPDLVDAVLTCWQLLKHRGTMKSDTLREQYQNFPAGYSSEADWWTNGITPVLNDLPGVKPPADGGSFYQFTYQ